MANNPVGLFDEELLAQSWFDPLLSPPGWFDTDLVYENRKVRPVSDYQASVWTPNSGSGLWQVLNDTPDDDATYISRSTGFSASPDDGCKLGWQTDPNTSSGHKIGVRAKYSGGSSTGCIVNLYEGVPGGGGTLRAQLSATLTTSFATYEYTLSAAEANAITDYSNLYLEFGTAAGAGTTTYRSEAWFEVSTVTTITQAIGLVTETDTPLALARKKSKTLGLVTETDSAFAQSIGIFTNLKGSWPLNEASGNALDTKLTSDLAETGGTISSVTGKLGNARRLTRSSSQYFTHADSATLSTGDINWVACGWVKLTSLPGAGNTYSIFTKDTNVGAFREYTLDIENGAGFRFYINGGGGGQLVSVGSNPSTGVWYFLKIWQDRTAQTINLQVDNGTIYSTNVGANYSPDAGSSFRLGAREYAGFEDYLDGDLDEWNFWKGRLLSTDNDAYMWNGGTGRSLSPFAVAIGLLTETDSALRMTTKKSKTLGIVSETDSTFAQTSRKSKALGLVTEVDSLLAFTGKKSKSVGLVTEVDSTFAFGTKKSKTIGLASETDSVFGFTGSKSKVLGLVIETDEVFSFTGSKSQVLGLVTEVDSVFSMTASLISPIVVDLIWTAGLPALRWLLTDPVSKYSVSSDVEGKWSVDDGSLKWITSGPLSRYELGVPQE